MFKNVRYLAKTITIFNMNINNERILEILDKNCRATLKEIAAQLNISKQAVHKRLLDLEGKEIASYLTIINYYEMGYNNIHIYLKIRGFEDFKFQNKLKKINRIKNIAWLADFLGDFDIGLSIFYRSLNELENTLKQIYFILAKSIVKKEMYIISRQVIPIANSKNQGKLYFEIKKSDRLEIKLSSLDRNILHNIASNSRFSYLDLSEKIGISRQALKERINKLEKNNIILGYKPMLNYSSLGCSWSLCIIKLFPAAKSSVILDSLLKNKNIPFISLTVDNNLIFDFKSVTHSQFKDFVKNLKRDYNDLIEDCLLLNVNKTHKLRSL